MALTEKEKQIVEHGKENGKSEAEVLMALSEFNSQKKEQPSSVSDLGQTISDTASGIKEDVVETGEEIGQSFQDRKQNTQKSIKASQEDNQTWAETAGQGIGELAGFVSDTAGSLVKGAGKAVLPDQGKVSEESAGEAITSAVDAGLDATGADKLVQKYNKMQKENPRAARNIGAVLSIGELAADVAGGGAVTKAGKQAAQEVLESGGKVAKKAGDTVSSATNKVSETADSVSDATPNIRKGTDVPETAVTGSRKAAEESAPKVTTLESRLGFTPAQKRRFQKAGPEKTQQYIDAVKRRNVDDTAPTPMEFGGDKVRDTVEKLDDKLQDSGSQIGKTREKLATIEANIDQVENIEKTFKNELDKLNLEVQNDEVVSPKGKIAQTGSQRDLNVLTDLWKDIKTVKESPKLTNLVDLRSKFDNKVKFGKKAQEVSDSVDNLSRNVRSNIAETMRDVVGPSKADDVEKFSKVIDARDTLKSFTDRRAGGEYLLRVVQSGRGGEAREIINTVKDITGRDLMDDAVLMRKVTDVLGSDAQKTLFEQKAGSLGIDEVFQAARGNPGAVSRIIDKGIDAAVDEERILRGAAE